MGDDDDVSRRKVRRLPQKIHVHEGTGARVRDRDENKRAPSL